MTGFEMNIECFLPVQEEIRLWSDRKKKVERVLIPMMIFVYVNSDEQRSVITLPVGDTLHGAPWRAHSYRHPVAQMEQFRFMIDFSDTPVRFESAAPG